MKVPTKAMKAETPLYAAVAVGQNFSPWALRPTTTLEETLAARPSSRNLSVTKCATCGDYYDKTAAVCPFCNDTAKSPGISQRPKPSRRGAPCRGCAGFTGSHTCEAGR